MELITASLEIAKEALVEAGKAAVEAAATAEVGETAGALAAEQLGLEDLSPEPGSRPISFGSLASGELHTDERYLRWKDGIDTGEINKKWITELANEISAIYGNDRLEVNAQYFEVRPDGRVTRFDNAAMDYALGEMFYDPKYLQVNGNRFGADNILGTLAHEVGHRVVYNLGLADEISLYENEACADYIAGLTSRLCKLNGTHKLSFYNSGSEVSPDGVHPGKSVRMEAFIRGFDRIDRGEEASSLRIFEAFSPYDLEGIYQDPDLLRKVLYEDVIEPLRNGEIKKV